MDIWGATTTLSRSLVILEKLRLPVCFGLPVAVCCRFSVMTVMNVGRGCRERDHACRNVGRDRREGDSKWTKMRVCLRSRERERERDRRERETGGRGRQRLNLPGYISIHTAAFLSLNTEGFTLDYACRILLPTPNLIGLCSVVVSSFPKRPL